MSQSREPVQLRLFERVLSNRKLWRDAVGLLIIAFGLITLITLLGWNAGGIVTAWSSLLRHAFGLGAIILCVVVIILGIPFLLNTPMRVDADRLIQIIGAEVAFFSLLALIHSLAIGVDGYTLTLAGSGGGAVGWAARAALRRSHDALIASSVRCVIGAAICVRLSVAVSSVLFDSLL